jgi:hypothetical protein
LSAPGHRAPDDLFGGIFDVRSLVDQRRVLSAEFEHDRRQVLGGRPRHDLPGARAAREEDEVEGKLQKLCRLFAMTCDSCHGFRFEVLRNEVRQQ